MILQANPHNTDVTYNNTELPIHDTVGRFPPLDTRIIHLLLSTSSETVNPTIKYGHNILHIALHVKNVPEHLINCLYDSVHRHLLLQTADNGMTPLHVA